MLLKTETRRICTSSCYDKTATVTVIGIAVNLLPFFIFKYMMPQGGVLVNLSNDRKSKPKLCRGSSGRTWYRPLIIRREKLVEVVLTCGGGSFQLSVLQ